ncbi:hypothetical protein [uncultured Tateyamaria sp.]|uniref:hypothetical protein n=1 Tax=uncultured Tateyamaria sp. TaxID=455651 RepID=UPI00262E8938|nr:hypothetical protein [uncultured Tateyamaria sp.]
MTAIGFLAASDQLQNPWPHRTTGEVIDMGFWIIGVSVILGLGTDISNNLKRLNGRDTGET